MKIKKKRKARKVSNKPKVEMKIVYSDKINPGDTVCCGDIHGRLDLLDVFLESVRGKQATVILLGDMIDRGPDDLGVLERVEKLLEEPGAWGLEAAYALRGNHEQMYLDACEGYKISTWANNGGKYRDLDRMSLHSNWVRNLPIYMTVGDTLFTHAGTWPGVDPAESIEAGKVDGFVWLREPFMTVGPELEKWTDKLKRVVHGHTPFFEDDLLGQVNVSQKGDRIGIDSGGYFTSILTSYNATQNTFTQHTV
jgi:serine/threonine protein phosphatase 1